MKSMPWVIFFGYLALLAGMRSSMNDTSVYVSSFENQAGDYERIKEIISSGGKDIGFDICTNFFKMFISSDYHHWFLFVATIETILLVAVLKRESYSFLISCFYFWASTLYYNYFSMMRQWLAVSIVFAGVLFLKERKWLTYILTCVLAAQFHNSAYLCIPLGYIIMGKTWTIKQKILIPIISAVLLFLYPMLETLSVIMEGTTYDYVVETMQTSSGSSPVRILISFVPVVLSYMYRDKINSEDNKIVAISSNMMLINFFLNVIATFTSGLYFVRMATYTNIFGCIFYPYVLEKAMVSEKSRFFKLGFYVFYFLFYFFQMSHQGAWGYISDIIGTY
ncbi:EpsG family protein [Murimonas intestini]|uniref:EpsG-like putative glucosyltransferase n=1 Tax=Murimonas intestini TaxID=1337051 RepID=A0AB73T747_9FIRM|nr:EpsG family protein [Murimonas intestini]MCR1839603.1 EpsG family protein [Murimonas intestini]MCR1866446.1 EpsG family protein [Murimonas intestini]MCR1882436.1 EpsG family protein [Murimonas intestini]